MVALADHRHIIGHRVILYEATGTPYPFPWVGEVIDVFRGPDGEETWEILDDDDVLFQLPFSQVADWKYDDVRLEGSRV